MADAFYTWQNFPALASLLPQKIQYVVTNRWAEVHTSLTMIPCKRGNRRLPHLLLSQALHFAFSPQYLFLISICFFFLVIYKNLILVSPEKSGRCRLLNTFS